MAKETINFITLGCAKNTVDSEHLAAAVGDRYDIVFDSEEPCEVVIINTCGFILDAKEESIEAILAAAELKNEGQIDKLYVFGCLSQRYKDELRAEIPEVDEYYGARTIDDIISDLLQGDSPSGEARILSTASHYGYLKISEGCNWGCGYCAIPLIRGRHRSVPIEELIAETHELVSKGVKELIVIAQDTTYYGVDLYGERRLGELLNELCKIEGVEWIRLHYAYPTQFPDDVIEVMAAQDKICKYIDIPLQHISDRMLSSMRRGLSKADSIALIEKLRSRIPTIAIRTTMLVGYPGETEQDIEELLEFVEWAKFERLGVFPYSQEEGTYSARELSDSLSDEEKQSRADRVMALQQSVSLGSNERLLDQVVRVLIDREEGDFFVGRTQWDSPEVDGEVLVSSGEDLLVGEFVEVRVTKVEEYDIYGVTV
ncbi:MAG: 30S ribosomal protein S12 methylthiotransferase RimO [Rikenellaceae bacterium]